MCKPDRQDTVGDFYNHAWGILNKSGRSFVTPIDSLVFNFHRTNMLCVIFS